MLSFKPTFSLSSFTFIKRLFSSSLLSAKRVVSSAYLRLFIFLPHCRWILYHLSYQGSPSKHQMRCLPLKLKQKLVIKINPFIHPVSVYYMSGLYEASPGGTDMSKTDKVPASMELSAQGRWQTLAKESPIQSSHSGEMR